MLDESIKTIKTSELPAIPPRRYFTIGEAAQLCGVKPHVLRYWEQEFPPLRPSKRRGNRRYYQEEDILLVRKIRDLLYDKGFTIEGARQNLLTSSSLSPVVPIKEVVRELEKLLHILNGA